MGRRSPRHVLFGSLTIALITVVGFAGAASAATYVVNTLADSNDGSCGTPCSLRDAMAAAHSTAGPNTITFSVNGTISLSVSLPQLSTVANTMTIDATAHNIVIDAGGHYRVFEVDSTGNLSLINLTIKNGADDNGGGAWVEGGRLTVAESTFRGNSGDIAGGAIESDLGSTLTVTNTTFYNNSTGLDTGGQGGAIFNQGTATVTNSTFYNNFAGTTTPTHNLGDGGAIFNGVDSTLTVTNSTLSGNYATDLGGGIYNAGALKYANTIIANSTGSVDITDCYQDETNGSVATNTNNLVVKNATPPNDCGTPSLTSGPNLGPLQNNGGPTETMALLAGSPAIDAGDNASALDANGNPLLYDQRGIGFPRILNGTVDIGAYESLPPVTVIPALSVEGLALLGLLLAAGALALMRRR